MILPIDLLPDFWNWLRTNMGIHPTVHDKPKGEEYGRFMWGGDFVIVRSFGSTMDAAEGATVEIHMSVPEKLEELERGWGHYWATVTQTYAKELDHGKDSKSDVHTSDVDTPGDEADV